MRDISVQLETWYEGLVELDAQAELGRDDWEQILKVKTAVNKELENQRNAGKVKASLSTELTLYADEATAKLLNKLGDELRFVLISSAAEVAPLSQAGSDAVATELEGLKLRVQASEHAKCDRCWHQRPDVGAHAEHPELCGRCIENVSGAGEQRHYA